MKIEDVIKSRIEYAKRRAEECRAEARQFADSAIGGLRSGDYGAAQLASARADRKLAEARTWEQCIRELLEPIALFVESQANH